MTDAQWQHVRELTADALDRESYARLQFVESACVEDAEVRKEVLRLLSEDAACDDDFLSTPLLDLRAALALESAATPRFREGERIAGRFDVQRFVAHGGMGEVYAATDLELNETVALKTIGPAIASSPEAIRRFKQEVKESRRITHRCVCRVYDLFTIERGDGEPLWFLTMELLDGPTLREHLAASGPLGMEEAGPLIEDVVAALDAAHTIGIVHRDFKPSNVMLAPTAGSRRRAVVTDFGLAVNLASENGDRPGFLEGTPAYMPPEQVSQGRAGAAADQFALGLVMCEMLTGARPVLNRLSEREYETELEAWLERQPRGRLDARAREAIRRCLKFRPEERYSSIRDVLPVLDGGRRRSRRRQIAVAATLCASAMGLAVWLPESGTQLADTMPLTSDTRLSASPSISRDGKRIAYMSDRSEPGNLDIWIQPVSDRGEPQRLTTDRAGDTDPTISPDGSRVAFRSERNGGGVYIVNSDGSGERLLAARGRSPAFSPDGRSIAYWVGTRDDTAPFGQLYVIPAEGGTARRLATEFADARYPTWNSAGDMLLFDGCRNATAALATCTDWWAIRADGSGATDTGALAILKSQGIDVQTPPVRSWRNGELFFSGAKGDTVAIWEWKLSPERPRPAGLPRQITSGDAKEREPSVAVTGAIAFNRATGALHIWRVPLGPGGGPAARVTEDAGLDGCPSISANGRLFFTRKLRGIRQLYARDLQSGKEWAVATSGQDAFWPVTTASGERVIFERRDKDHSSLWLTGGPEAPRMICGACSHPASWMDGDRAVFYSTAHGEIAILDVESGVSHIAVAPGKDMVLRATDWNSGTRRLLFTSASRGGAKLIYAAHIPTGSLLPDGNWSRLLEESADVDQPHWAPDGNSLYFLSTRDGHQCLWGIRIANGSAGAPFPLMHFHDPRLSPSSASPIARGLTVGGDAVYLNVGEVTATVWAGKLIHPSRTATLRNLLVGR
jgi:eukaryotic-like serine/threonine-protein kinase